MGDKAVGRGQKSQKMDGVIYGWPQRLKSVVDILEFEKGNVWKTIQYWNSASHLALGKLLQ